MEDINLLKTLIRNRVVYKTHWVETYEVFILLVLLCFIIMFSWMFINDRDIKGLEFAGCFFILIAGLAIYKYARSGRLVIIENQMIKTDNRSLLEEYLSDKGFNVLWRNDDYLIALSKYNSWFNRTELTLIYQDNKILMNIVSSTGVVRFPSEIKFRLISKEIRMKFDLLK